MSGVYKISALLLIVVFTTSSLLIESASAQSIPKPSVPQFTVNYVKSSYDVEATYTTDPYTGETEMTRPAKTVTVSNIEIVIKNQAFSSYQTAEGNYTQLRYCVRTKGHYEQWMGDDLLYGNKILDEAPASSSDNTILTFPLNKWSVNGKIIGPDGKIDFQVKAIVRNYYTAHSDIYLIGDYVDSDIIAESDWSSTQTFTVPSVSSSASPTPTTQQTPTPTPPQQTSTPTQNLPTQTPTGISLLKDTFKIVAVATIVALLLAAIFLIIIKNRRSAVQERNIEIN